ncbi:MAG TPA: hypothetical protein VJS17_00845, partial [Pyrinomonadaceae bacterium]|nr:hypothetical protein [Pyrinomonadaceae bacterium]
MKPDRWQRVDELFEAALERDSQDRAAFIEKACGDDQQLRREVEKMLRIDEQATEFIQTDAFAVAAKLITRSHEVSQDRKSRLTDSIDDARFIPG